MTSFVPSLDAGDRRAFAVIEDVAPARDLDDFSARLLDSLACNLGVRRLTLWLGTSPRDGLELSSGEQIGLGDSVIRRYVNDFIDRDPFRQEGARFAFESRCTLRLDGLRSHLPIESVGYLRSFLAPEGITEQCSAWLDTGSHLHGYVTLLNSRDGELPAQAEELLRRLCPTLSNLLALHLRAADANAIPVDMFTPAERRVVDRLLQGEGNAAIARQLGIGEDTVKKHVSSAYRRAGTSSRAQFLVKLRHLQVS